MTQIQQRTQVQEAPPASAETGLDSLRTLATPKAIWTAIAVVALLQAGVAALRWSFVSSTVRPLRHDLAEMPRVLGTWTGKDVTMDRRIVEAVAADQLVDRMYENAEGTKFTVSSAVWLSPSEWVPHQPPKCYAANGWKSVRSQIVTLPNRPNATIAIDTYEQSGERVVVGYWYQLEELTYLDRVGARGVRTTLWGKRQWSPLIKTLIQTGDSDSAEAKMVDIASHIYEFNCGL
jgi:uncharacterized protein DUF3485